MTGYLPEVLAQAKRLGFTLDGHTGGGHPRLRNDAGDTFVLPRTPSDWRSRRNSLSQLERLAGQRLPRGNAGHYRHRRQAQLRTQLSPAEQAKSAQIDALLADAGSLRQRFDELVTAPNNRTIAAEARSVLAEYERIRRLLARCHRIIDPLATQTGRDQIAHRASR